MRKKSKFPLIWVWSVTILSYLPIAVAVIYSFNASKSSAVWTGFTFKWYLQVFKDRTIMSAVISSLILGLFASVLSAFVAVPAALAFRKHLTLSDRFVKKVQMIPLMLPEIVMAVSYLAFFRILRFPFGMVTLILGHMTFCIPYIFIQLEPRIALMDSNPSDAARLMGAGPVRAFLDVTLPYISPALLSGLFLSFAMSLDDVIITSFVTSVKVSTLALKIYSQVKTVLTPKVNALCTMLLLATILCMALAGIIGRKKIQ